MKNFNKSDDCVDGYWTGPYGVLVSNDIYWIVATDGYNICDSNGKETQTPIGKIPLMNENIYKEKYAIFLDGKYYYCGL